MCLSHLDPTGKANSFIAIHLIATDSLLHNLLLTNPATPNQDRQLQHPNNNQDVSCAQLLNYNDAT